jgi:hypothetical protein
LNFSENNLDVLPACITNNFACRWHVATAHETGRPALAAAMRLMASFIVFIMMGTSWVPFSNCLSWSPSFPDVTGSTASNRAKKTLSCMKKAHSRHGGELMLIEHTGLGGNRPEACASERLPEHHPRMLGRLGLTCYDTTQKMMHAI